MAGHQSPDGAIKPTPADVTGGGVGSLLTSLLFVSLGVAGLVASLDIVVTNRYDLVGPRFVPQVASAVLVLTCLKVAWDALRSWWPRRTVSKPQDSRHDGLAVLRSGAFAAGCFAYLAALTYADFRVVTPIAAAGLLLVLGVRKWVPLVTFSVGLTVAVYVIFTLVFSIELP